MVWDLVFYVAVGAVLGGRLGYVLFYNATYYLSNPIEIFSVWTGGMSFHGGLLGVIVAVLIFARRFNTSFSRSPTSSRRCAPGLMAGRIGNFINQELWGRVSEVPWAVVFPAAGPLRHPCRSSTKRVLRAWFYFSWFGFSAKPRPAGRVSGMFLLGYAVMRLVVEMFREPDAHLGFIFLESITMGQILKVFPWDCSAYGSCCAPSTNPPLLGANASNGIYALDYSFGYARIR